MTPNQRRINALFAIGTALAWIVAAVSGCTMRPPVQDPRISQTASGAGFSIYEYRTTGGLGCIIVLAVRGVGDPSVAVSCP